MEALDGIDFAEICITSGIGRIVDGRRRRTERSACPTSPASPSSRRAPSGRKCARSWRFTTDVGSDPAYPDLSARDAAAMREIEAA